MYETELQLIGFSPNEAKIYETLLKLSESGVTEIANKSNVHRRSVYDTLMRLVEKGFVFQIFGNRETLYRAVHPQKCLEILKTQENNFKKALPGLTYFFEQTPATEAAFIYRGLEGYKNYCRDLARIGEDTYFLGAKANWFRTSGVSMTMFKNFMASLKANGKEYYTLFDPRVKTEVPEALEKIGGQWKILPEGFATPGVVDVCGDHVFTFTNTGGKMGNFGGETSIFVMVNKDLAESYRTWFKLIWELV